jgi:methionine biosynthesis protein MetW
MYIGAGEDHMRKSPAMMRPDSPDAKAGGFLAEPLDPLRYGHGMGSPVECDGLALGMIPRGARVLDVGCGVGDFSAQVRDGLGATVMGIEPDAVRAAESRRRGLTVSEQVLGDQPEGALGQFDAVLYMDVLEHLSDPGAELRAACEVLAPGGAVIASIPNVAHWSVRVDLLRGHFDYARYGIMDATHLRWFTARTVRTLFESAGLRVVEHRYSAGIHFDCYRRRPWRWLPGRVRRPLILQGVRLRPRLFGAQHVVRAVRQ